MKNSIKISTIALVCAVCTWTATSFAAPSVRSFGTADTYSSGASSSGSAIGSVRAGSLRMGTLGGSGSGSSGASNSDPISTVRAASSGSNARLSIGRNIGRGMTLSGGGGGGNNGGGTNPGDTSGLQGQIDVINDDIDDLKLADIDRYTKNQTDDLLNYKQDVLVAGDGISIVGNIISALGGGTGEPGPKGDKGDQGDPGLSAYEMAGGDGEWGSVGAWLAAMKGEKGDKGDKGDPGDAAILGAPTVGDWALVSQDGVQSWIRLAY